MNSRRAIPSRDSGDPPAAVHTYLDAPPGGPPPASPAASPAACAPAPSPVSWDATRELRLLQQTEHLAAVGGWEFDFKSRELYWTGETYRIHETSPERYTPEAETALAFFLPESREIINRAIERAMHEAAPWDLELQIKTARGRTIDVRVTCVVQSESGHPVRACGAIQDITSRKHLEQRLLASGKMETIGRMAGGLAHDFNNWITAILSYSEIALRTIAQGSPEHQAIVRVRQSAEHATSLTRQLISLARPRPTTTAVVDINELVQSALPLLTGILEKTITFQTRFHPGPLYARVNASQFRQVLMNLILNARDAMPAGGFIDVATRPGSAAQPPIDSSDNAQETIILSISDSGEGMTRETLEHLFEPFFTTKPGGKGTGLGLATCYSIIKASGGDIEVSSTPGQGSTFTIFLPRATSPASAPGPEPGSGPGTAEVSIKPRGERSPAGS